MNEVISGLMGALFGVISTLLTLKHNTKIESRRLRLAILHEKKLMIECAFDTLSCRYTDNIEEEEIIINKEYNTICKFLFLKSHYFYELVEYQKIMKELSDINDDANYSTLQLTYFKKDFNIRIHNFLQAQLNDIMKKYTR